MALAAKSRDEESLQGQLFALKKDHSNEVQELATRISVSEEAQCTLKQEANRLSNDIGALIQAKNSVDLEKRDLEAGASKLTADLCYVINPN
ncbi:unnamed protein product [Sphagnum jensenii]|uniref:Uncharacterized protein n=1 Tax=Sphagnum jensenii TaxID=128206 RepID=A0ABP1BEM0_9BRYO